MSNAHKTWARCQAEEILRQDTEHAILEARPVDLAELLAGALLTHLPSDAGPARACIVLAHEALSRPDGSAADALPFIRVGLLHVITADGIACTPETILLQVLFWLLTHQADSDELAAVLRQPHSTGGPAS